MFIWKLEDMKLMEMPRMSEDYDAPFACEADVSTEDKFLFVDTMQNGQLSYITNLVKAYREAIPQMKKDAFGNPSSYARKAWVRQNDTKEALCRETNYSLYYGDFALLHTTCNLFTYPNRYGSGKQITEKEFIDHLFHNQLLECLKEEKGYFFNTNEESRFLCGIETRYCNYGLDNLAYQSNMSLNVDFPTSTDGTSCIELVDYKTRSFKKLTYNEIQRLATSLSSLDDLYAQLQEATLAFETAREAVFETMKGLVN